METPNTIMIQTTNVCQLKCKNCYLENGPMPIKEMMSFETFKGIVDRCQGVSHFHLTPIVGESTLNKDFYKMLDYVCSKEGVKKVSLFTNFITIDVEKILKYKNLYLIVSVYGSCSETYKAHTQMEMFEPFFFNMKRLYKGKFLNPLGIEFFMRNPNFDYESEIGKMIILMKKCRPFDGKKGVHVFESFWNGNWCGEMVVENMRVDKKEGICAYAPINNSIDINGDIILCGACDIKKTTVIGNLFDEKFEDIYHFGKINNIFEKQKKNIYEGSCANCSEFHKGN